jgi:hypothetical protein
LQEKAQAAAKASAGPYWTDGGLAFSTDHSTPIDPRSTLISQMTMIQSIDVLPLACLRDCGLVTSRPYGRASMWSLDRPELFDLLAAAERLLAATGAAVTLCPNYGKRSA